MLAAGASGLRAAGASNLHTQVADQKKASYRTANPMSIKSVRAFQPLCGEKRMHVIGRGGRGGEGIS